MKKRFKLTMRARYYAEGYSFLTLWFIGFLIFMAVPLGRSLYFSFNIMNISSEGLKASFVGLSHYKHAFVINVTFLPTLTSTIGLMLLHVPLIIVFSLFSALLINKQMVGRTLFRGIFFLPVIVASGAVLQKLLEQGAGTLPMFDNYMMLELLFRYAPYEIVLPIFSMMENITLVMWDSGVQILIFVAGLQTISKSLYEAAECDGATRWESFWHITFPMIKPMIFVNILFSIVYSFTKVNNGIMKIIRDTMLTPNFGYSAALGWIYFIMIFIIIGIVFYMFRNSEGFSSEGR